MGDFCVQRLLVNFKISLSLGVMRKKLYWCKIILSILMTTFLLFLKDGIRTTDKTRESHNPREKIVQDANYEMVTLGSLWRPEKANCTSDRIFEQYKWTKWLANSTYIKIAKPKRILVYNDLKNYYGTAGKLNCPFDSSSLVEKCQIVEDKAFYGFEQAFRPYDAVIGVRHWNWRVRIYEPKIPAYTLQFLYILESPYVAKYADLSRNNAILSSYWRGSDIVLPYGKWQPFPSPLQNASINLDPGINLAKKTKLVAILVSNCGAKNDRLKYVKQLQRYIPVDVYGSCGPLKCSSGSTHESADPNLCMRIIQTHYKFYLAFEKANCREYVTEKFFQNALGNDAVPVVLGAHPEDYKAVAPPNSYIHVEDFQSPKHLAQYLVELDKNKTLYNEYFAWKTQGEIIFTWNSFFCRVCGMLFYADLVSPPPTWKTESSWNNINHCLPPHKWYWEKNA